jgi:hypothetical protein
MYENRSGLNSKHQTLNHKQPQNLKLKGLYDSKFCVLEFEFTRPLSTGSVTFGSIFVTPPKK